MSRLPLHVRYVGGPTAFIELGGLALLTDPTFDPPGDYPVGTRVLTKTLGPALSPDALGPIAAVLLSHAQHADNLDTSGRELLATVPLVLSTPSARARLGGTVRALSNWEHVELSRPDGGLLRITAVPAHHGPEGSAELVGEVTGFVLESDDLPTVYVSGDNASLKVVHAVADRFAPVDIALLFAGAAQTPLVANAFLTLTSEAAAEAARILAARAVVPLHFEGWAHYTQGRDSLMTAFKEAGLAGVLHMPAPGEWLELR